MLNVLIWLLIVWDACAFKCRCLVVCIYARISLCVSEASTSLATLFAVSSRGFLRQTGMPLFLI